MPSSLALLPRQAYHTPQNRRSSILRSHLLSSAPPPLAPAQLQSPITAPCSSRRLPTTDAVHLARLYHPALSRSDRSPRDGVWSIPPSLARLLDLGVGCCPGCTWRLLAGCLLSWLLSTPLSSRHLPLGCALWRDRIGMDTGCCFPAVATTLGHSTTVWAAVWAAAHPFIPAVCRRLSAPRRYVIGRPLLHRAWLSSLLPLPARVSGVARCPSLTAALRCSRTAASPAPRSHGPCSLHACEQPTFFPTCTTIICPTLPPDCPAAHSSPCIYHPRPDGTTPASGDQALPAGVRCLPACLRCSALL